MQLPTISPAQRHFTGVFGDYLSIGAGLGVAPDVTADLVDMVEPRSENLTDIAAPSLRMSPGHPGHCGLVVNQEIQTWIEQVKHQPAGWLQMAAKGQQRLALQPDCQQVLKGAGRDKDEAKAPAQVEGTHVLIEKRYALLHCHRKRGELATRHGEHGVRPIDADHSQTRLGERQGDASSSTGELKDGAAELTGKAFVEGNDWRELRVRAAVEHLVRFGKKRAPIELVNHGLCCHGVPQDVYQLAS